MAWVNTERPIITGSTALKLRVQLLCTNRFDLLKIDGRSFRGWHSGLATSVHYVSSLWILKFHSRLV